jgi:protein-S-isoprenylcysteine O-methyltransferase Ste14
MIMKEISEKYKKNTRKAIVFLILLVVSASLGAFLLMLAEESASAVHGLSAFALIGLAMYSFVMCVGAFFERGKKYKEDEATSARETCPSCGNYIDRRKEQTCQYCGLDLTSQAAGPVKSRLSDEEVTKKMLDNSAKAKKYIMLSVAALVPGLVLVASQNGAEFSTSVLLFLLPGIALLIAFFLLLLKGMLLLGKSREMFKVNIVRDTLAELIEDCVYTSYSGIDEDSIKETRLIDDWDRCSGSDHIKGKYKGHEIEISDVDLSESYTDKDGETQYRTKFRGQWLKCKLDKTLPAALRLREWVENSKLKSNAETESAAFNSKYQILADDPHTMFYVLTPHFMEYIVNADIQANARTFFCFAGDTVHVALKSGYDLFEARGANKDLNAERQRIRNELKYVTDILDELLLNDNLF